jgi:hypothetical protein
MYKYSNKLLILIVLSLGLIADRHSPLSAAVTDAPFPNEGIVNKITEDHDSFYDPTINYAYFAGRISDRDVQGNIYKIQSENNNIKYFRAGDGLELKERLRPKDLPCRAYVQGVEEFYLVVHIPNMEVCRGNKGAFRIGSQLDGTSDVLKERILYASQFRLILLRQKKDLLKQFSGVNEFLWTFKEEEIKVAAFYDKKILVIQEQKKKGLDDLLSKRKEYINLQKELASRMHFLDESLHFYRIERQEFFYDRWHLDHDLGLPMYSHPPKDSSKVLSRTEKEKHRWYQGE